MYRKFDTLWPGLLMLPALLVAVMAYADDSNQADVEAEVTVHEFVMKQDSVFSLINTRYQVVKPILKHSCFDCHSDSTDYPWYYKLPIVKGFIDDDIAEGLKVLDLTHDFPFAGQGSQMEMLGEIKEEIEEGGMPILSYRMLHWGTLIEGEKRDSVFQWIDSATSVLKNFYEQHGEQ